MELECGAGEGKCHIAIETVLCLFKKYYLHFYNTPGDDYYRYGDTVSAFSELASQWK